MALFRRWAHLDCEKSQKSQLSLNKRAADESNEWAGLHLLQLLLLNKTYWPVNVSLFFFSYLKRTSLHCCTECMKCCIWPTFLELLMSVSDRLFWVLYFKHDPLRFLSTLSRSRTSFCEVEISALRKEKSDTQISEKIKQSGCLFTEKHTTI